jgi:hypothetical protein
VSARLWRCGCGALNAYTSAPADSDPSRPGDCRRCGEAAREGASPTARRHAQVVEAAPRRRARALPWLLLAVALLAATRWDLVAHRLAAAHATPVDRDQALALRVTRLRVAAETLASMVTELRTVAPASEPPSSRVSRASGVTRWEARLDRLAARAQLDGDRSSPQLARAEVSLRAVALELRSLRRRIGPGPMPADVRLRLDAADVELQRATEDLAHAF